MVGARPQFIKLAPMATAMESRGIDHVIVHTGQHYDYDMSDVFFRDLHIPAPDVHLAVGSSSHGRQTGAMLAKLDPVLEKYAPDWVVVYGDTNSTTAGAIAAVKMHIPLAHLESGLRSYNRGMPEEHNRIEVDRIAWLLFCPDDRSQTTLEEEGVLGRVYVVGDVMADAARIFAPVARERFPVPFEPGTYVVATIHRQANVFQPRLGRIVEGLNRIEGLVVFPAHPRTRAQIEREGLELQPHVRLTEPLSYLELASLASQARVIVTDSGGLQKEAYWYGVPCVTPRPSTEWVDTVAMGANVLVDDDPEALAAAVAKAALPAKLPVLYGDGHASERITQVLLATMPGR